MNTETTTHPRAARLQANSKLTGIPAGQADTIRLDLSRYVNRWPWWQRLARAIWGLVWLLLFRPSPRICFGWRAWLLRCFGARIGPGSHVYPGARIWAPWNLEMGRTAAVADGAVIYNPDRVVLGDFAIVSQEAFLCTASHDYTQWSFPLITGPIRVGRYAWVAARAFVHPGVSLGEGCVVGAGSVVTRDLPAWSVCAGNPCRVIKVYAKR